MIGSEWASSGPISLGLLINNQYVTVKKIGVGGFGTVWLAYDFSLRNFVAIKELLPEYAEPKFIEMFYKDALIAKNIIHDNVVRVQHFWQGSNGSFYIVLDYVRGLDLEVLLKKCKEKNILIPWQLATLICMNVLKAVDYANRIARDSITGVPYGIVYRDISPGNVLMSFDGNIKLSDFGVARTADEIQNSIPERVVTGKYPYMSPEQVRGEADVDHRTDIFSLGSLYYEILTGEQLYQGTNDEIRDQIINKPFDASKILEVSNSQEIADIISKALHKNRDDRYERAIEMYKDVRRVLRSFDTEDLAVELSNFIAIAAKENVTKSEKVVEAVKALNINDVQNDGNVIKIQCKDFIVGQPIIGMTGATEQSQLQVQQQSQPQPQIEPAKPVHAEPQIQPKSEEKVATIAAAATTAAATTAVAMAANSVTDTNNSVDEKSVPVNETKNEQVDNSVNIQKPVSSNVENKTENTVKTEESISVPVQTEPKNDIQQEKTQTIAEQGQSVQPTVQPTPVSVQAEQEQNTREEIPQTVIKQEQQSQENQEEKKAKENILATAVKPKQVPENVQPVASVKSQPVPVPQQRPPVRRPVQQTRPQRQQPQPQVEAKGKTVFEEVGDWLFKKFDNLKKTIFKIILVLLLAIIILLGLDIFLQITPFGKSIYAKLNPPDVIITTTPEGALVSMKTKSGDVVLNNQTAYGEIPVRKVAPGSYIVTALKDGFKPVQRVVQIEPSEKANKVKRERIEIMFDFVLNVDSMPKGASVYVDGNKFGVTPCNIQLIAAPHTIKLSKDGFADLGSNAKESKAGQCNVDFSKSTPEEIFDGVDSNFWKHELKNVNGEDVFCVSGSLFKQLEINTDPEGMTVQVEGETSPRGTTPLHTQFKVGNYNIKLFDPSGRYGEITKELLVDAESETKVFVKMNKFVTFSVKSKNSPNASVATTVKISNKDTNISEEISTSKPFKVALPVDEYDVLFLGNSEYKPFSARLDVNNTDKVTAYMEYIKMSVVLIAKDAVTKKVLPETFIWMGKTLLGKTDKKGMFKTTLLPGKYDLNFINKEYEQQPFKLSVLPGKKLSYDVEMNLIKKEEEVPVDIDTEGIDDLAKDDIPVEDSLKEDDSAKKEKDAKEEKAKEKEKAKEEAKAKAKAKAAAKAAEKKKKQQEEAAEEDDNEEQQIVVCPHCGYVNTAPISRKLRFCVNCAKPLK